MTTTYDPFHLKYFVEADLREEMNRVYDLCHGCRLCFKFCPSFPTMFEAIDRHDDQDASKRSRLSQSALVSAAIRANDADAIAGDCSLANGGIVLETGRRPLHPIQQFARAYGIREEPVEVTRRARQ